MSAHSWKQNSRQSKRWRERRKSAAPAFPRGRRASAGRLLTALRPEEAGRHRAGQVAPDASLGGGFATDLVQMLPDVVRQRPEALLGDLPEVRQLVVVEALEAAVAEQLLELLVE